MATWVELRCENRGDGGLGADRCWSDDNAGPMGMAEDSIKDISSLIRTLKKEAITGGWKLTKHGWLCPVCKSKGAAK